MAAENFSSCLPFTLRYEGGLSMTRSDPGNWTGGKVGVGELRGTNFGIAASSHPSLDIAHLTKADASAIYDREYWTLAGCEALAAGLDLSHFDATVNSGRGRSTKWLAAARQDAGTNLVGSIHAYAAARLASLESFAAWATFGKGWAARVAGIEAAAIKMATDAEHTTAPASEIIAAKGAQAATKAKIVSAVAKASTAVAGASVTAAAAGAHPYLATGVGLAALISAIWSSFSASVSGARAATLAHAAVT